MKENLRVLFSCTGIGVMNRGIESFFREAFDGLKDLEGVEAKLITGGPFNQQNEKKVLRLSRFSPAARVIGRLTGRSSYAIEQISSFPAIVREIKKFRPDVIFSSEANLFFLLNRFRSFIGVPYKLLYSNGGPVDGPFGWTDYVHQVTPVYVEEAINKGEPEHKHIHVPYGIHVPKGNLSISVDEKTSIRNQLGLPVSRNIVISVGWISSSLKRMDYTVRELALIPKERRPFLLLLDNVDESSQEIFQLAKEKLDEDDYLIRSVPYSEVANYYKAADIFVLSSLKEGFGRVYLEALMYNLPVIAHHHPVMQYVVGEAGILADLSKEGNLGQAIQKMISQLERPGTGRDYVRNKFDWKVLAPRYRDMFQKVKEGSGQPKQIA
jgi:glycosyltransferase involved in cell wall biosynthesis